LGLPPGMNQSGPITPAFEQEYISWEFAEATK
jgi:hypothetical protein